MPEDKPVVYILRGDDREAIESHIHNFYSSLGEPNMAELNTTHLEAKLTDLNDLRAAALAMPFLTERRLVVLDDALKLFVRDEGKDQPQILALLDSLPPSTALVLVIPDVQKLRKHDGNWETYWITLGKKHWLMKWAVAAGSRVFIQDCILPKEGEMAIWIRKKASELGGSFTLPAAQTLAAFIGNNTQRAVQEITKLLTYVNFERPVEDDDVRRLSIWDRESDIFELVDAIGSRDGQKALKLLHLLLEEMLFVQLFSMVIRQFRLLLQAQEILDTGGDVSDVAKLLGQYAFVARKVTSQAGLFDLSALESIYHHLLKIDLEAKTGGMEGKIAMDLFITRLAKGLM